MLDVNHRCLPAPRLISGLLLLSLLALGPSACGGTGGTLDYDTQKEILTQHLAKNPHHLEAYRELARQVLNVEGDIRQTRQIADECAAMNPNNPRALLFAAEIYSWTPPTGRGFGYARSYTEMRPDDPEGYLHLARMHVSDRDVESAQAVIREGRQALREALTEARADRDTTPDDPEAEARVIRLAQGVLAMLVKETQFLMLLGRAEEALTELAAARSDSSLFADAGTEGEVALGYIVDNEAKLRVYLEERDAARTLLENYLADAPFAMEVVETYVYLLLIQGDVDGALDALVDRLAESENPKVRLQCYVNLAFASLLDGDLPQVREWLEKAEEINENDIPTLWLAYYVAALASDGDDEIERLSERLTDQGMALLPPAADLRTLQFYFMGQFLRHFYLENEAWEAFRGAHERDPRFANATLALAAMAEEQHDYSQAITYYRECEDVAAIALEVCCQIGDCYLRLNQPQNALAYYQKALSRDPQYARAERGKRIATEAIAQERADRERAVPPESEPEDETAEETAEEEAS